MTAQSHPCSHPVTAAIRGCADELSAVAETPLWSMGPLEAGAALVGLTRLRARVDELTMRVLRHAEVVGTGSEVGATSATSWWAHQTRTVRSSAYRLARVAEALERHPAVRSALAQGGLVGEQARVIVEALDDLPDDVEGWVLPKATSFLLELAADHDAKALRVLARRLLEVIDPVAAEAEERRRLEAEEQVARERVSFTMSDAGDGTCHGRFRIPAVAAAMLRAHLQALASPARAATGQGGEGALSRRRLGAAFVEYIESRHLDEVPSAGGTPATVVVTMELATLLGGLGAASLDSGGRISAGEARRLACRAGVIPVVLGGAGVVLDVGRRRRFHSEAQRVALGVRDGGCTAVGCDAPPGMCHAHHDVAWSKGGSTDVATGRLLCPKHHRRIHDPAFGHCLDKHGKVLFTRRT